MNNHAEHIESDKHLNDPNNDETILSYIEENKKLPFF